MQTIKWAILLSVFWLLLSGYIQPLMLSFGVISVAIVVIVLRRMDALDSATQKMGWGMRTARYLVWLMGQILLSSAHVTKLIWSNPKNLSPTLAKVSAKGIPKNKRVLYANSITLTPGTLSVDLENDEITVHALQSESIDELKEGGMERKISGIWNTDGTQDLDAKEGEK